MSESEKFEHEFGEQWPEATSEDNWDMAATAVSTTDMTCLGMKLHGEWSVPEHGTPLDAVVVVKAMRDGETTWYIESTEHLGSVECLGMLRWAQVIIEAGMLIRTDEEERPQ